MLKRGEVAQVRKSSAVYILKMSNAGCAGGQEAHLGSGLLDQSWYKAAHGRHPRRWACASQQGSGSSTRDVCTNLKGLYNAEIKKKRVVNKLRCSLNKDATKSASPCMPSSTHFHPPARGRPANEARFGSFPSNGSPHGSSAGHTPLP